MKDRDFQEVIDFVNGTVMMKCVDFLQDNNSEDADALFYIIMKSVAFNMIMNCGKDVGGRLIVGAVDSAFTEAMQTLNDIRSGKAVEIITSGGAVKSTDKKLDDQIEALMDDILKQHKNKFSG